MHKLVDVWCEHFVLWMGFNTHENVLLVSMKQVGGSVRVGYSRNTAVGCMKFKQVRLSLVSAPMSGARVTAEADESTAAAAEHHCDEYALVLTGGSI